MQSFNLYQLQHTYDTYGQQQETYELIDMIQVKVSYKPYTVIKGDIVYNILNITGYTPYTGLKVDKSYKLINEAHEYLMTSFTSSHRATVLYLKEV